MGSPLTSIRHREHHIAIQGFEMGNPDLTQAIIMNTLSSEIVYQQSGESIANLIALFVLKGLLSLDAGVISCEGIWRFVLRLFRLDDSFADCSEDPPPN